MALTERQQQLLADMESKKAEAERYTDVSGNPWLRTAFQGASLGFGEEIEAAVRSLLPETMGGGEYNQIRDELRTKLAAYKEANPKSALTLELAGALVPTLLTLPFGGAGAAATGARLAPTMTRVAGRGAVEGAVTGAGVSESDTLGGMATDAAVGAVTGAVLNPTMTAAGRYAASNTKGLVDFVRAKMGDKASNAVQAELRRLQEQTGKSTEEILFDLQEGRLMSDNKTLAIALKNMVNQGGESGKFILGQSKARAGETRNEAMDALGNVLSPNMDKNVVRGFKRTEQELLDAESASYRDIFDKSNVASEELVSQTTSAVQSLPSVIARLERLYGAQGKISPYSIKDGKVVMSRTPTLEDAEKIRGALSEETQSAFKGGEGSLGVTLKQKESALRGTIDATSDELKNTRANWANIKGGSKAFDVGRKSLSANVDELEMTVEALANKPDQLAALRAGLMDAIRNKVRKTGTTLANLADADKQFGQVLRTVLTGQDVARLERQLSLAGDTAEIAKMMPPMAGSPTQPLSQEAARSGTMGSLADAGRAMSGDPTVVIDVIGRFLKKQAPSLSDTERLEIAQTLFSSNPELVRKALTDQTALSELMNQAGKIVTNVGVGARTGLQQQATQNTTGLIDRIRGGQ